jgi:16S rRNA (cytosine967-C5)-methyltransferase
MNTKLHKNTVEAVEAVLREIFEKNRYADKAIETILKSNKNWGARDRAFIAESSYNIVRYFRLFSFLADSQDISKILTVYLSTLNDELPNWLNQTISAKELQDRLLEAKKTRAIRASLPDWLDELLLNELGESRIETELEFLNQPAEVWIRANLLKIPVMDLKKLLPFQTETSSSSPTALKVLGKRNNLFILPAFREGFFEVQDLSSQLVAPFLRAEPGMRVVDACAGAGGKTLHLAAIMQNKGKIIALDTEKWKLDELRKRARRAGASLIETRLAESKTIKRLADSADRVLLDVPCSGLGVLRRNPDAKWKLSKEFIERIKVTQAEILDSYSSMVKVSGLLVYSTCSILPSENEQQVERFLSKNKQFRLLDSKTILPSQLNSDGFFMAVMEKKD